MLIDATMTGKTTEEILKAALDMHKVFLKKISPIHGKTGYFRVTPGSDEECERFLKFIKEYFG
jgi:histidinol-phosphate/aromatic aminotransferase/cobyric acid decarboxylase-like protein